MVITNQTKTSVSQALADVNQAARADIDGTGKAHSDLLESIQKLRLAAEKPEEILMRQRFEVEYFRYSFLGEASASLLTAIKCSLPLP